MTTLQEYLNNLENKEQIKEINLAKIQSEREKNGASELLEGGELDLRAFTNLEKLEIDPQFLSTFLTKLNVEGLSHLKEVDWLETKPESEGDKKLFGELGISSDISKKRVVKEVKRLAELFSAEKGSGQKINLYFATEQAPQEKLTGRDGLTEVITNEGITSYNIYLKLDQNDKLGNFCPSLVFWNLSHELAIVEIGDGDKPKTPTFWSNFDQNLEWVKQNVSESYFQELEQITVPSTFPTDQLEMSELLAVYYPNKEEIPEVQTKKIEVSSAIINETWQTIKQEILKLVDQELKNSPDEEQLKQLAVKIIPTYFDQGYSLEISYHSQNPFKEQMEQLIANTPLKLEIEQLKQEKEQLPTTENFAKLVKQTKFLENYLQGLMIEEEYLKVKEEMDKID